MSINLKSQSIDIQGHRGCRGLFPENTIPGFLHALKLGVNTLECDVVISKDNKVIVSHEPYFNHEITTLPNGEHFTKEEEESYNIYHLTYEEIKFYDVGSKFVDRFPLQYKIKTYKPTLEDVVSIVETQSTDILYNIEIKRKKAWDGIHHPSYKEFADLVIDQIVKSGIMQRTTVQCFDIETLKYINNKYPNVRLVYLIENKNTIHDNIKLLGFIPNVYSPYFKLIDTETVTYCKASKMKLIPWTVNDEADLISQIKLGVDGIISDYPDRLIKLMNN